MIKMQVTFHGQPTEGIEFGILAERHFLFLEITHSKCFSLYVFLLKSILILGIVIFVSV